MENIACIYFDYRCIIKTNKIYLKTDTEKIALAESFNRNDNGQFHSSKPTIEHVIRFLNSNSNLKQVEDSSRSNVSYPD